MRRVNFGLDWKTTTVIGNFGLGVDLGDFVQWERRERGKRCRFCWLNVDFRLDFFCLFVLYEFPMNMKK